MGGLTDVIESKILPLVAKSAPLLGTLLGSPLAGVGVSLLAEKFGLDPSDIDGMVNALSNPGAAAQLQALELNHKDLLAQLASQDYATEVDDRKNARLYADRYKDFLRHMAYLVTAGFFATLGLLFIPVQLSAEDKQLLSMLIGMLSSKWQTIIDFFYGSSSIKGDTKWQTDSAWNQKQKTQ